jgi:hypothetical protein
MVLTAQQTQAQQHLNAVFESHGYQKEAMVDELMRVRSQDIANAQNEKAQAEKDLTDFLNEDTTKQKAHRALSENRNSPFVSRDTQAAILKGMILDYEKGRRRPGLSALTVLKAVELLNKMTGYEAPVVQEVHVDHKVNVLPIIGEVFQGHLEPLEVIDIGAIDGDSARTVALPSPENRLQDGDDPTKEELFP